MKMQFMCSSCRYKFERDKKPAKCPYCGKDGTIERTKSAQELLDSLTEMDEQLEDTRDEMKKYR